MVDTFTDPFTVDELHTIIGRVRREAKVVGSDDYRAALRTLATAAANVEAHIALQSFREGQIAKMHPLPVDMVSHDNA